MARSIPAIFSGIGFDSNVLLFRFLQREADSGNFWGGVDAPWEDKVAVLAVTDVGNDQRSEIGADRGSDESCGTRADENEIVVLGRIRVFPILELGLFFGDDGG